MTKGTKGEGIHPLALTMWDFSWIERRWPGAGYEDWDLCLKELIERGYNAVRIDTFPHLVAADAQRTWTLKPLWSVNDWGSPARVQVKVQPALNNFIEICAKYGVKVGLSSWYREDTDNMRMKIKTPQIMGEIWIKTLQSIKNAGLLDTIFYVDFCNEWPGAYWAPYFINDPPEETWGAWYTDKSRVWMKKTIDSVRHEFPELPLGFSFDASYEKLLEKDTSFLDYLELHIWMSKENNSEFYEKVGYTYDRFKPTSYENLVMHGERVYRTKPEYWHKLLMDRIKNVGQIASKIKQPLMTSECWGLVDFKDWPMLDWQWIKELCALGAETAAKAGQWAAISTSNFCGPQFVGMWRDVKWHQDITEKIRSVSISEALCDSLLIRRINS